MPTKITKSRSYLEILSNYIEATKGYIYMTYLCIY